jgi:hypothetical protein
MKMLKDLNTPPPKDTQALLRHFAATYFSLRIGMALLAVAFPLLLVLMGHSRYQVDTQPSLSAYFWAVGGGLQCASFPLRTVFAGVLVAIAMSLYAYKGYTTLENWLLNFAAICAVVVALYPERLDVKKEAADQIPARVEALYQQCPAVKAWAYTEAGHAEPTPEVPKPGVGADGTPLKDKLSVHYVAAVSMFVCLFLVAMFCAHKSLEYLPANSILSEGTFKLLYRTLAVLMAVGGGVLGFFIWRYPDESLKLVLYLEWWEIWIFAAYWGLKTLEMSQSKLEKDTPAAVDRACAAAK